MHHLMDQLIGLYLAMLLQMQSNYLLVSMESFRNLTAEHLNLEKDLLSTVALLSFLPPLLLVVISLLSLLERR